MIRLTAVIEVEGQGPRALTHESNARSIVIGRDASADFQLPLSTVSRHHARIAESDGVYVVEDLGSTHGTLVSGKKLGKGDKKVLKNGDVIELTRAKITCNIEAEKIVAPQPGEGTQAIAARAVQGILGRLGDAKNDGPYLRVLSGPDEGARFLLSGTHSEWALGRSKECEFVLNDPNVSRRHATVKKDWNGFTIQDLGSKNGVQVNDKTIKGARRLKDRDEITIGPVKLVYVDPDAELMDALKDVPGFAMEEPPEEISAEPSHLGAPDGEAGALGGAAPAARPSPEDELAAAYDAIDPALLKEEAQNRVTDWVIIGVVGLLLVTAVLLLFA
ncbi:MAG: FHA domain-containing protein, partial [Deltaproteobacteria bacterium]|nr:FHA domain-containing protein [Deltaproteobacteria bacterium]